MGLIFVEPAAQAIYASLPPARPIERAEQEVLGVSRLTADPVGREIWLDLCAVVYGITGLRHQHKPDPDEWYQNGPVYMKLPEGDVEGIIHEMCHWITAAPRKRQMHNLGLNDDTLEGSILAEEKVWSLESWLFSTFISEEDLGARLIHDFKVIQWGGSTRWVNDPVGLLIGVLHQAKDAGLDVMQLRGVLGRWAAWERANPIDDEARLEALRVAQSHRHETFEEHRVSHAATA